MRKFTLSLLMAATSLVASVQAQTPSYWSGTISTNTETKDLQRKTPMAIDDNGNTYVTGSFTDGLNFGASYLQPVATSAFVAKFDKLGNQKWAAGLIGAATITSIATDAEGFVYVAGTFADIVKVVDPDGQTACTISGMEGHDDQVSAFIAKYSENGEIEGVRTIIPKVTKTDDINYFLPSPAFIPKKIQIVGDRLVLAASYKTECEVDNNLTLTGQYGWQDWGYTFDVATMGIVSFSKQLDDAKKIVELTSATTTSIEYAGEDINFTTDGDDIYAAFVATGDKVSITHNAGSMDVQLKTQANGEETLYEHAWIVAQISNGTLSNTEVFHSNPSSTLAKFNTIDEMTFKDGKIYLAGTFNEDFPFNAEKSFKGSNDTYLACLDKTLKSIWSVTSDEEESAGAEEEVTGLLVMNNDIMLGRRIQNSNTYKTIQWGCRSYDNNGNFVEEFDDEISSMAQNKDRNVMQYNNANDDKATMSTYMYLYVDYTTTGIANVSKDATSDNSNAIIYTLDGAQVGKGKAALNSLQKGVYVIKNGNEAKKIIK